MLTIAHRLIPIHQQWITARKEIRSVGDCCSKSITSQIALRCGCRRYVNDQWSLITQAAHGDGERQDLCSWERSAGWGRQSKGGWSERIFIRLFNYLWNILEAVYDCWPTLEYFKVLPMFLKVFLLWYLFHNVNDERSVSGASQPDWFSFCQNGQSSQPVNLKTLCREIKHKIFCCLFHSAQSIPSKVKYLRQIYVIVMHKIIRQNI